MEFTEDPQDESLRHEIRKFIAAYLASHPQTSTTDPRAAFATWTRALSDRGWLVPHWPVECGGNAWGARQNYILQVELTAGSCPPTDRIALDMVGPIIASYGSSEQRQKYLPRILHGEHQWCQGFSEPQAGSDVMSIKTRALRDRDHYIVSGRKIWITSAHLADMMFALVRVSVDGKLQHGLTFLLIDMKSRGIKVTPIQTIDGKRSINEVLLGDVFVPVTNCIGEEGKGWVYARSLLGQERALIAGVPQLKRRLQMLEDGLRRRANGTSSVYDASLALRIAKLKVDILALEFSMLRILGGKGDGRASELMPSILKIRGAELRQTSSALLVEAMGDRAFAGDAADGTAATGDFEAQLQESMRRAGEFLYDRASSIAGGTTEIQRNIVASALMPT